MLPGDTFDVTTSKVVRLQTLMTPIMDNIYLDTYFFFVPNRLVWEHWKEFMGENTTSAWLPETTYRTPTINFTYTIEANKDKSYVKVGEILDYMGVPIGVSTDTSQTDTFYTYCIALPYRAYQLIYNEWFRDENLVDPVNIDKGDTNRVYVNITDKVPYKAAKFHDYFTSALPAPQKGPAVGAPLTSFSGQIGLPVFTSAASHNVGEYAITGNLHRTDYDQRVKISALEISDPDTYTNLLAVKQDTGSSKIGFVPDNLYADIGNNVVTVGINSLRQAIQIQKFYERAARSGSRYIETIKAHFGVESPDARMQRPEYLGGNRIPISIHQITNQSQGENAFLGDLGAMSLTTDKHSDFVKSFTEHGFIIGLVVARYDHSYPQGIEKFWRRRDMFDYYWPEFANLGEQPIYVNELFFDSEVGGSVFGYQERYAEYRYKPNRVAGEMRPGIDNTLDSWHLADYYTERPYLSADWIAEDKTNVDRVLAVTSEVSNQIFADIYVQNWTTRPMPVYSIPGLMDHH